MITEELTIKIGKEIDKTGYYPRGNRAEATILYINGISDFDDALNPYKFEETNCLLEFNSCENGIIIFLLLQNAKAISYFPIWRENVISFEFSAIKEINVPKFELLKSITPLGLGTGVVGLTMAEIRFNKFLNIKDFKVVGCKPQKGKSLKLKYYDETLSSQKEILLNVPDEYELLAEEFFSKQWKNHLTNEDKTSSKCYIASACYKDRNAPEVLYLKSFRDVVLYRNFFGRFFIKLYYKISPILVCHLYNNEFVKKILRILLDKLISTLKKAYSLPNKQFR